MSVVTYGNVRMQIQRTEHLGFGPVYTEDGADYLYTEVDLAVTAVCNPFALATKGPGAINNPPGATPPFQEDAPAGVPGDSLGATLRNLRAMLLTPRQTLSFSINGDQVVTITGPDSRNGPQPQRDTSVRWIMGTRTALVYFHIKAWTVDLLPSAPNSSTPPSRRVVLANRYRVTSTTDEDWYSRRHIVGQMIVDISQLETLAIGGVLTPDNFRQAAFLQIPSGFKRENIQVVVSSDNTTLDYSYVDQETPLALGPANLATRIEGMVSCGVTSPLANASGTTAAFAAMQAALQKAQQAAAQSIGFSPAFQYPIIWAANQVGLGPQALQAFQDPAGTAAAVTAAVLGVGLPKVVGTGTIRIWGQRNASRPALAALGINILLDRFFNAAGSFAAYFTPGNAARMGQISITHDIAERMVEVSASFIPTYTALGKALFGNLYAEANSLLNPNTDIKTVGVAGQLGPAPVTGETPILTGSITGVNPPPPLSGGTRGDWLGALLVSLLGTPGELPINAAQDPATNIDVPGFV